MQTDQKKRTGCPHIADGILNGLVQMTPEFDDTALHKANWNRGRLRRNVCPDAAEKEKGFLPLIASRVLIGVQADETEKEVKQYKISKGI